MNGVPLIPEQRHARLLSALRREGVISIRSLADALDVSHMTIRRDIAQLEAAGQVLRVQGGVRLAADSGGHNAPLELAQRRTLEMPRKRAIARRAAEEIEPGSVLFLDAGTTTQALVPHLSALRDLTVVTNDFIIVNELLLQPQLTVIHTGGNVDAAAGCADGMLAADIVGRLNIDTYFVSTAGWSRSRGVTAPSTAKALLKQAALAACDRAVLMADSTKYGAASVVRVFGLDQIDLVITDDGLSTETCERLIEQDIEVALAPLDS